LVNISLIPLTILAWRGKSFWTFLWLLIGVSQLSIAIIQFSKTSVLQVTICLLLGLALRKKSLKILMPAVGLTFLLLILLTSYVLAARTGLSEESGLFSRGTFSERLNTARELPRSAEFNFSVLDRFEIFWARCCYVPAQVFVMNAYDAGSRGVSLELGLYALMPRFLWPEKPVISSVGTQFNALLTGNPDSSSSPGIYGELYWGGGWIAVLIGSFFVAILLSFFTNYSKSVIETKQWHLLPVVIIGLTIGYRVDGWLAGDYVNLIPIVFVYHLLFSFLGRWCRVDNLERSGKNFIRPTRINESS
jgi:hypothetical protein